MLLGRMDARKLETCFRSQRGMPGVFEGHPAPALPEPRPRDVPLHLHRVAPPLGVPLVQVAQRQRAVLDTDLARRHHNLHSHPLPLVRVNGNTVRSFSTHGQQSAVKGSSTNVSRSDIRLIQYLDFRLTVHGLIRRWLLSGYLPIHLLPLPLVRVNGTGGSRVALSGPLWRQGGLPLGSVSLGRWAITPPQNKGHKTKQDWFLKCLQGGSRPVG